MYDKKTIDELIRIIEENQGKGNKDYLEQIITQKFHLQKKSKGNAVWYCDSFAIRFCSSKSDRGSVSNTVMTIKYCKQFDSLPLLVCVVGPSKSIVRLANATLISKLSHTSVGVSMEHLKGSINSPNIMKAYNSIPNEPDNFETLFKLHSQVPFEKNLERIIEATDGIKGIMEKFVPTKEQRKTILEAPQRTCDFMASKAYTELKDELDKRTMAVASDIYLIETFYDHDVKLRGSLIEFFITSTDEKRKEEIRKKIKDRSVIKDIVSKNDLGDYSAKIDGFSVETDIKSKLVTRSSTPKLYNIEKLLKFLSEPSSVYLLYIILVDGTEKPRTELVSAFQKQILEKTRIDPRFAGKNTRGTTQSSGKALEYFLTEPDFCIDIGEAKAFLERMIDS